MNKINWKYVKELKNQNAVKDFLKENNVKLPVELIKIITNCNGGRPTIKDFETVSGKSFVFKSLLSYNKADTENIYAIYPLLFVGTNMYPIAYDSAGNIICYELKKKHFVLWLHESNKVELINNLDEIIF